MIDDGHLFMVTRPAETAVIIESFWPEKAPVSSQNPGLLFFHERSVSETSVSDIGLPTSLDLAARPKGGYQTRTPPLLHRKCEGSPAVISPVDKLIEASRKTSTP